MNEQRNIITNWYKKPTFSGGYLNYNSHHPISNKIAIIYCLVDRAIKLSHIIFHEKNTSFIKLLLKKKNNDYPHDVIEYHVRKRLKKIAFNNNTQHTTQMNNNTNKRRFIVLPLIKEIECSIKNFLRSVTQMLHYWY